MNGQDSTAPAAQWSVAQVREHPDRIVDIGRRVVVDRTIGSAAPEAPVVRDTNASASRHGVDDTRSRASSGSS
jgi:type IV secretory pathway VirB9-like protein